MSNSILTALKRIKDTAHKLIWDKYGMTPLASRQHELLDIVFEAISKELGNKDDCWCDQFDKAPKYSDHIKEDSDV